MRAVWLADVLSDAGLTVRPYQGWETRGGDDFDPKGVILHHTVTRPTTSDVVVDRMLAITGSSKVPPPLCNWSSNRDGSVSVIAAGTANHGGVGRWQGVSGNRYWFGDEMKNLGTRKEPWPQIQLEAARTATAAVLSHIGADVSWMCGHKEYAPGRKVDPHTLDMHAERQRVEALMTLPLLEDEMQRPSWFSDAMLEELAGYNIKPRDDESEDMWRMLTFLHRAISRSPVGGHHHHDGRYVKDVKVER